MRRPSRDAWKKSWLSFSVRSYKWTRRSWYLKVEEDFLEALSIFLLFLLRKFRRGLKLLLLLLFWSETVNTFNETVVVLHEVLFQEMHHLDDSTSPFVELLEFFGGCSESRSPFEKSLSHPHVRESQQPGHVDHPGQEVANPALSVDSPLRAHR
jgi:hypothetical protein